MTFPRARAAFSLLELLVVIGIISLVLTFLVPTADQALRGSSLTQAGQLIGDQIAVARQAAVANNRTTYVRFYQLPADVGDSTLYRGIQIFSQDDDGTLRPIAKMQKLNQNVEIADSAQLSTLITTPTIQGTAAVPGGSNADYVGFRFYPNGSTDLDPTATAGWYVTLVNITPPTAAGEVPKNFYTISVNPYTGRTRVFRP